MKNWVLYCFCIVAINNLFSQNKDTNKKEIKVNSETFYYYESSNNSSSVIVLFHDWFGVSDLSFELVEEISSKGIDVIILDLYKGKSAKTNAEARKLMNSADMNNIPKYIDDVFEIVKKKYDNIYVWGFSLGTQFASQTSIKFNNDVRGLILFYGNVPQNEERLKKMTFPSLMVMGSRDNPNGAIKFFNDINNLNDALCTLYIYPNVGHAFAQKLFNGGANYNKKAKIASFEVAFSFIENQK